MITVKLTDRDARIIVHYLAQSWALAACRAAVPDANVTQHWCASEKYDIRREKRLHEATKASVLRSALLAFVPSVPPVKATAFLIERNGGGYFHNATRRDEERERLVMEILNDFHAARAAAKQKESAT
jgi:hypothetical protein